MMKKSFFSWMTIVLMAFMFAGFATVPAYAQMGVASQRVSLEDNSLIGIIWEPMGTVYYYEEDGRGIYVLEIRIKTSSGYLGVEKGNKVSIEYVDGTREVVDVLHSETHYQQEVSNGKVTEIYMRDIMVCPDFNALTTKQLKRFVIQRTNGNMWIIDTAARRSKKLLREFSEAMSSAVQSYRRKVNNNNYFNQ